MSLGNSHDCERGALGARAGAVSVSQRGLESVDLLLSASASYLLKIIILIIIIMISMMMMMMMMINFLFYLVLNCLHYNDTLVLFKHVM